jgi:hypothetical protein
VRGSKLVPYVLCTDRRVETNWGVRAIMTSGHSNLITPHGATYRDVALVSWCISPPVSNFPRLRATTPAGLPAAGLQKGGVGMSQYNFRSSFVPYIENGEIQLTVRTKRKRQLCPGELLYLYTGLRTPRSKLIFRATCKKVQSIIVRPPKDGENDADVQVDGIVLSPHEMDLLARLGGFSSFAAMMHFWDGKSVFEGDVIHWDYSSRVGNNPKPFRNRVDNSRTVTL